MLFGPTVSQKPPDVQDRRLGKRPRLIGSVIHFPPAGLTDVSWLPAESTATQSDTRGQDSPTIPARPGGPWPSWGPIVQFAPQVGRTHQAGGALAGHAQRGRLTGSAKMPLGST